ncbi:uncharacterized protein LOC121871134 [Homarus americanus]|uniref:uncharacterized protein LOC121871134 n=1 Tax=Homarus americanus TaxID=6706 RepID=UPI001C463151|nr:uncharacterized protein LOC121871134 [Homarus americanus]
MRAFVVVIAVVVVVVLELGSSRASRRTYPTSEEEPRRRLCGWRLANKLNLVCKGVYNNPGSTGNYLFYRSRRDGESEPGLPPEKYLDLLADPEEERGLRHHYLTSSQQASEDTPSEENEAPGSFFGSLSPQDLPHQSAVQEDEASSVHFPFLTEEEASQMVRVRPRSKRGLSAECCRKVCTVSELVGYCY